MSLFPQHSPNKKPSNVCPSCQKVSKDKHCRSKTCDIYWCMDCRLSFAGDITSKALVR